MVLSEQMNNLQKRGMETVAQVETFALEHRELLQTVGLVTAAVVVGGAGGYLLAKGALVFKGTAAAKAGATAAPPLFAQGSTGGVTTLQSTASFLNNSIVSSTALMDKLNSLLTTVSTNAVPLTVGAVGGGAAGVGATRYQVRQVKDELEEQKVQTAAVQTERSRLEGALATAKASLSELQARLTPQVAAPVVQERLEQIRGIGRVFAQKLNAAGIYTMADLAAQTPERLREIVGTNRAGSMIQPAEWIQQARQLIQSEGTLATKLGTAVPAASTAAEPPPALTLDRLEAINGITPAIAARLNQAGILTYAGLAGQTTTRIQEVLGPENQLAEKTIADWIVAARTLATQ